VIIRRDLGGFVVSGLVDGNIRQDNLHLHLEQAMSSYLLARGHPHALGAWPPR
jgi:hypothetical protein